MNSLRKRREAPTGSRKSKTWRTMKENNLKMRFHPKSSSLKMTTTRRIKTMRWMSLLISVKKSLQQLSRHKKLSVSQT